MWIKLNTVSLGFVGFISSSSIVSFGLAQSLITKIKNQPRHRSSDDWIECLCTIEQYSATDKSSLVIYSKTGVTGRHSVRWNGPDPDNRKHPDLDAEQWFLEAPRRLGTGAQTVRWRGALMSCSAVSGWVSVTYQHRLFVWVKKRGAANTAGRSACVEFV